MDRRFFMQALAGLLGMFGLGKVVEAKEDPTDVKKLLKWHKWLRKCDEFTMNAFKDTVVVDECGEAHTVPIIWAAEDKAADFIVAPCIGHTSNPQFEKLENDPVMEALRDRTVKIETDTLRLPLINIYRGDFNFAEPPNICIYYTMTVRTLYKEDMNQIIEQIVSKFHPTCEYEVGTMELLHVHSNIPGDNLLGINKYQFDIKVKSLPLENKK